MELNPMDLNPMELNPMELNPMELNPMEVNPMGFITGKEVKNGNLNYFNFLHLIL